MKRILLLSSIAVGLVSGCNSREIAVHYTAVERDRIEMVKLKENVRFANRVHAKGQTSELVRLSGGKMIVLMPATQYRDDMLVSVVGPVLSSTTTWAVEVDKNLCTTGNAATITGSGSPREGKSIGMFEGYSISDPNPVFGTDGVWSTKVSKDIDPYFCFERV